MSYKSENVTEQGTYLRVETDEFYQAILPAILEAGNVKHQLINAGGQSTKHMHVFTFLDHEQYVNGDLITPQAYIINSFNKESNARLVAGFVRFACMNTMFGGELSVDLRLVHRVGPAAEQKLREIKETAAVAVREILSGEFASKINGLAGNKMTAREMIAVVKELPNLSDRSKRKVETLIALPGTRRPADRDNNQWTLWNMVNEEIRKTSRNQADLLRQQDRNKNLLENIQQLHAEVA